MPKGLAAIILAKKQPKKGEESADEIGRKALAQDLISAVKDGNQQAVIDSVRGLFNSCQVGSDE